MVGRRQKHPDKIAFKRGGRYRALPVAVPEKKRPAPACLKTVGEEAEAAWNRLWQSSLSHAIADTDLPALYRWIWWFDQWVGTAKDVMRRGSTVRGSRGDETLRARVRYLRVCEASLEKLEETFGMTPLARMRLGLTYSEGQSALARLRTRAKPRPLGDDPRRLLEG